METGTECELAAYPTPEQLWNLTFAKQNAWRDRFSDVPFEDRGGYFSGRYYQDIAIERVLEAVATNKQRILLTLATVLVRPLSHFRLPGSYSIVAGT